MVDELSTGRFLGEERNIVFLGPPGVGKTHLAIGLGVINIRGESDRLKEKRKAAAGKEELR